MQQEPVSRQFSQNSYPPGAVPQDFNEVPAAQPPVVVKHPQQDPLLHPPEYPMAVVQVLWSAWFAVPQTPPTQVAVLQVGAVGQTVQPPPPDPQCAGSSE